LTTLFISQSSKDKEWALQAVGNHSHTSRKFQDDLIHHANAFAAHGNCLIEVGCYRGGLTAQFAAVAAALGQEVHVIDIDEHYLEVARGSVQTTVGTENVTFHLCDLTTFAAKATKEIRPSLVLIDGDNRYAGVIADIRALFAMPARPFAAAFHDFSLRHATPDLADVRVDLALKDTLGKRFPHTPIGELARAGGFLTITPGDDGHYHETGYPEGVLVKCARLKFRDPSAADAAPRLGRRVFIRLPSRKRHVTAALSGMS
jgi:hypothetical protein